MIEQCKCCIFFSDGLLIVFLYFVCKLLSNIWEQHNTTMLPKSFCFWLLTGKQELIHPFLTGVNIVFLWILCPIRRFRFRNEPVNCYLWVWFSWLQRCLTISAALVALPYSIVLHTSLARVQDFSLMVTMHNSTALKENDMAEDIFVCSSFWSKNFSIRSPDTKKLLEKAFV